MELYLVRHGKVISDDDEVSMGLSLTKIGIEQAKKLGKFFKEKDIDVYYCSPLKRTIQTLDYIKEETGQVNIVVSEDIKERSMGVYANKTLREFNEVLKTVTTKIRDWKPEGGESGYDLYERAKGFVDDLLKTDYQNVVLITHNEFIECTVRYLLNLPYENIKLIRFNKGSITNIKVEDGKVVDFNLNGINHLVK